MEMSSHDYAVLDLLRNHDELYSRQIEAMLHIPGSKVRECVHSLRCMGVPIVGSREGYAITEDIEELRHSVKTLYSRVKSILEVVSAQEKVLKQWEISPIQKELGL